MIEFDDVSKRFVIDEDRPRSFQEKLIRRLRRSGTAPEAEFWALRHVSFRIEGGEAIAFVGTNGSGKSTILKLVSRIIYPTGGQVSTRGRVAAMLELGAGFHPDLTGRENVDLNGSILGLSRRYVRRQLDDIVAFSELDRFIDVPVRNYSSGMLMRLGFSVATAFQPDILLIDEVLAVGDQAFQDRCVRRIMEIQRQGATMVLVSHDLSSVQKLCRRTIWLNDGQIRAEGNTDEVISRYLQHLWHGAETGQLVRADAQEAASPADGLTGDQAPGGLQSARPPACSEDLSPQQAGSPPARAAARWGSGEVRIERVELLGAGAQPVDLFRTGDRLVVRMWYTASCQVDSPAFAIAFHDEQGNRVNGANSTWSERPVASIQGRGRLDYVVEQLPLLAGHYDLTVAVYDKYAVHPYDYRHRMASFTVMLSETADRQDGVAFIPCRWEQSNCE